MALSTREAQLLGEIHANVATLVKNDADKEKRLRAVERKQWLHSGVVALIAALFAKFGVPLPFSSHD